MIPQTNLKAHSIPQVYLKAHTTALKSFQLTITCTDPQNTIYYLVVSFLIKVDKDFSILTLMLMHDYR